MDPWEPTQSSRFALEQRQPFDELVSLCQSVDGGLVYDLGCGAGDLTESLHRQLRAGNTIGIDTSNAMLEAAAQRRSEHVTFERGDLATFCTPNPPDLIFCNASLQWVDQHASVLALWHSQLAPGGQLAAQVPCSSDHPAITTALQTAERHADSFVNGVPPLTHSTVEAPAAYAKILVDLGASDFWLTSRPFCHRLPSTSEVVRWMDSTTLTTYRAALGTTSYQEFLADYSDALYERLGQQEPYVFTVERILLWAQFN